MKSKTILVFLAMLALAAAVRAQTRISGTLQCVKPEQHMIEVGDQPNHFLGVTRVECTWSRPIEIAGVQATTGVSVSSDETTGNRSSVRGHHMGRMANGDAFHTAFMGFALLKDGAVQNTRGRWSFVGGTGKLAGIKGEGNYTGKPGPEGTMTYEVDGDYTLTR